MGWFRIVDHLDCSDIEEFPSSFCFARCEPTLSFCEDPVGIDTECVGLFLGLPCFLLFAFLKLSFLVFNFCLHRFHLICVLQFFFCVIDSYVLHVCGDCILYLLPFLCAEF